MSYQEDKLKEIADAIREKKGTTGTINASDFVSEIQGIQSKENLDAELNSLDSSLDDLETFVDSMEDTKPTTLIAKEITENGTYNASDDNADGYSSVTVNVESGVAEDRIDLGDFVGAVSGMWRMLLYPISGEGNPVNAMRYLYFEKGDVANIVEDVENGTVGIKNLSCKMVSNTGSSREVGYASYDIGKMSFDGETYYVVSCHDGDDVWANAFGVSYDLIYSSDINMLDEAEPTGGDIGIIRYSKMSDILLEDKEVTENGTITADMFNYDGLGKVTVAVASEKGQVIELSTDEEMTNALTADNLGKVYKFIGTSEIYETGTMYVIGEVE